LIFYKAFSSAFFSVLMASVFSTSSSIFMYTCVQFRILPFCLAIQGKQSIIPGKKSGLPNIGLHGLRHIHNSMLAYMGEDTDEHIAEDLSLSSPGRSAFLLSLRCPVLHCRQSLRETGIEIENARFSAFVYTHYIYYTYYIIFVSLP